MTKKKTTKKKDISMGNYVVGSVVAGTVAGSVSQATGSTVGSTMTTNLMKGAAKPVVPVMKIKGTGMVLKSVGTLKKPVRKLMYYKKKDGSGYGFL